MTPSLPRRCGLLMPWASRMSASSIFSRLSCPWWPLASAIRGLSSLTAGSGRDTPVSLIIFHRHGDRSPLKGHTPDEELISPEHRRDGTHQGGVGRSHPKTKGVGVSKPNAAATAEDFWRRQLVSREDIERLNKLYPIRVSSGEAVPPDEVSAPFGCLTSLGLQQLRDRGRRLRERYPQCDTTNTRLQVFSTNYRRTQISAQGFLDGFLDGRGSVPVIVRPRSQDFLNQWESQGREMTELMHSVEAEPSFQAKDEAAGGPLKRRLNALDPALFPLPPGGRFRWMMAADFFTSARARSLRVAPKMDALGTDTIRHLTWRFSRFYRDRKMIKMMVGPLLESIVQSAADGSTDGDGRSDKAYGPLAMSSEAGEISHVVSSSCHDVTILALLYAMESDLIENEDYWPPYGSTIMFAGSNCHQRSLRASRQGAVMDYDGERESKKERVLTITVDDEPLRSRLFPGRGGVVPLSDFREAVRELLP